MGSRERRIKEVQDEQSKYGDIDQMWGPKQDSKVATGGKFDFDMFGMGAPETSGHIVKKA